MAERRLPLLKPREPMAFRERLGFAPRALKATSHRRYVHPDGRKTTVPVHKGTENGRGLLRQIHRDIELTPEAFLDLLAK